MRGVSETSSSARSEILRPVRHRVVPDLVAILVENQLAVGCSREPGALRELALELTGRPARVAERHQQLLWSVISRNTSRLDVMATRPSISTVSGP